jgi:hypothetical protein
MPDTKHVLATITAIGEELELLPEVGDEERMVGTKEALRLLLPTIAGLQRKGYAIEKIAEKLADRGLVVSAVTLRGYLRGSKKKRKAVPAHKADGSAGEPPARAGGGTAVPNAVAAAAPAVTMAGTSQSSAPRPETLAVGADGVRRAPHPPTSARVP